MPLFKPRLSFWQIINTMIVILMILQITTFGSVLEHFLNNDPGKAISFGGVLLLIACAAAMRIKASKASEEDMVTPTGGH